MKQTWQWKPNQTVHNYRAQHRYYGRRRYSALAVLGMVLGMLVILGAIVTIL